MLSPVSFVTRTSLLSLTLAAALVMPASRAWADGPHVDTTPHLSGSRGSVLGAELHLAAVLPLVDVLCPNGGTAGASSACLLNEGMGVGGSVERRWQFGGALLLGYDLSFLSGSGVYEVGVLQTLRVGAKWVVPLDTSLKPYLEASVGALVFGDSFTIATAGGCLQFGLGGELEFADNLSLVGGVVFRGFSTGSFITPNDMVTRGSDPGANVAVMVQLGVLYLDSY